MTALDRTALKAAVCEAIERALPSIPSISGLRLDVKLNRMGEVTKVIAWPEVEFVVTGRGVGFTPS